MRTNIEIDDALMAAAMEAGGFKTKKDAVEAGLKLLRRRKVYDGLLALRGQLHWDDSDEAWAKLATQVEDADESEAMAVQKPEAPYLPAAAQRAARKKAPPAKAGRVASASRSKRS
jgi:antitoxin ParD1/3/4